MLTKRFWLILAALLCLLAAVAAVVGYWRYKEEHPPKLTRSAEEALKQNDYGSASIFARRALQLNRDYLPACKVMAEICEKKGAFRDEISWRKLIAYLSDGSTDTLIAYAKAAYNGNEQELARNALGRVPEAERERADFQAISGAVAAKAGNYAEAERCYLEATRLDPENQSYRFALGQAQANSEDFFTREAGRKLLASMTGEGDFDFASKRTLILNYEASNEIALALRESRKLVNEPGHAFSDEVLHLRILRKANDPEFAAVLATAQEKAVKNEKDFTLLLRWMSIEGLSAEAVEWAVERAPSVGRALASQQWLALAFFQLEDWPAVLEFSQQGTWDTREYIRHAYRARALHEEGDYELARGEWKMAVESAVKSEAVEWLMKSSKDWDMPEQHEQVLWAAIEKPQLASGALETLYTRYLAQKDTANLRRVSAKLVEVDPSNDEALNNFAMFSLLRDIDSARASETAKKLYTQHPDNPIFVSTYAFALYRGGRLGEALRVLESLPPSELEEPAVAAYYGSILAASRLKTKAAQYLDIAQQSELLPEERVMVEKARASLRRQTLKPKQPR